jgi:hypothetical protein
VPWPGLDPRNRLGEKKGGTGVVAARSKREMEEGLRSSAFSPAISFSTLVLSLYRHPCLLPFGHKYVNTGYGRLGQALRIRRARRGIIYDNFLDTNSSESCNNESRKEEKKEGKIPRRTQVAETRARERRA